jgi:hypothetical protein
MNCLTIITFIVGLLLPAAPTPKPPQGYLDCGFTATDIYICKP